MSSPSWLKETPLRFEDITRHHANPLTIYLPTVNDDGEVETVSHEKYDIPSSASDNVTAAADYQRRHLAKESGIHYRNGSKSSRALLWRTVSGRTLTIHCVDGSRSRDIPRNRPLPAFRFLFPTEIQLNCIGFSNSTSTTRLYVLTEDCVLYNIPLSDHLFSGEARQAESLTHSIRAHRPLFLQARFGQGKLSLEVPHFMHVLQDLDKIIFAMQDGTLHQYDPTSYGAIRFTGDATLRKALKMWIPTWSGHNPSYPSHIVISAVASPKHSLLFTISADQRLRIWSLENSHFIKEYDITSSPATSGRLLAQPPANLLAIDDTHDHGEFLFYLMSFNPLERGQFTIWGGEHHHGAFTNLIQLQDPFKPEVPPGSTGIWSISDFFLAEVKTVSDSRGSVVQNTFERALRLWISWKSYYSSVLQYTDILENLEWVTVMPENSDPSDDEIENSIESWTDRILKPGRFSDAVILTALDMYQRHLLPPEQHRDLSSSSRVLRKDMISGIVGCKAKLGMNQHTGQLDFEKYRQDLSLQFSQFEKTCTELSKPGNEFRRLSFDSSTGEVIIIRADGIVTVRNLSGAEILHWGATGSDGQFDDVLKGKMIRGTLYREFNDPNVRYQVLAAARTAYKLRCAVAGGNLGDITAGLLEEVMADSNFSVEDRLWAFYEKYLSDESFVSSSLREDVKSALAMVTEISAAFKVLLDMLSTDICQDDTVVALEFISSIWGDVATIGVAETVSARWNLLRDFALLTAWLYSTEEQLVDSSVKKAIEGYWSEGLRAFKGVNMLRHLAATEVAPSLNQQSVEDQVSGSLEGMKLDDTTDIVRLPPRTTGLRYLVEDTLDSSGVGLNRSSFPPPMALSLVIASVLTQINFGDGYSGMAIRIVSQLTRLGAYVEAARFARYLPNSPVGGYVWGHVLLEKGSWEKAASWFSRVAPILATSGHAADFEYAKVLLKGRQTDGIGRGLFRYYEHVAKLFEKKHAHSHSIYYCQRALAVGGDEPSAVKDKLLMLLFNNAVDIASYDEAYMALTQLTNYETLCPSKLSNRSQRGALEILTIAMVEHGQSGKLCSFPFKGLQDVVDEILLRRAEEVVDVRPSPSYHKVLFSWRIRHSDFQGAASVMYQRLQLLRNASTSEMDVDLETLEISEAYLAVINALSCVAEQNAWIFISKVIEVESPAAKRVKRDDQGIRTRMALSLEEVRKEYMVELERQHIILGKVADEFGLDGFDV